MPKHSEDEQGIVMKGFPVFVALFVIMLAWIGGYLRGEKNTLETIDKLGGHEYVMKYKGVKEKFAEENENF